MFLHHDDLRRQLASERADLLRRSAQNSRLFRELRRDARREQRRRAPTRGR